MVFENLEGIKRAIRENKYPKESVPFTILGKGVSSCTYRWCRNDLYEGCYILQKHRVGSEWIDVAPWNISDLAVSLLLAYNIS